MMDPRTGQVMRVSDGTLHPMVNSGQFQGSPPHPPSHVCLALIIHTLNLDARTPQPSVTSPSHASVLPSLHAGPTGQQSLGVNVLLAPKVSFLKLQVSSSATDA